MKRIVLLLAAVFMLASWSAKAQENDAVRPISEEVAPGMKYRDLKRIYDYKAYMSDANDAYDPAVIGLSSVFIPGLGQMFCGEVGRGLAWFGGAFGCALVANIGIQTGYEAGLVMLLAGTAGLIAIDVCAVVDACRVAKVKNMYERDLRQAAFSMELRPSVEYLNLAGNMTPTCGLTLAIAF